MKAALDAVDAFITATTTVPPSGYPPIVAAAIRERLRQEDAVSPHVLYVTAGAAGGETITRRGLFRRTLLLFMGGCHVSYLRLDVKTKKVTGGNRAWTAHVRYDLRKHELTNLTIKGLEPEPLKRVPAKDLDTVELSGGERPPTKPGT